MPTSYIPSSLPSTPAITTNPITSILVSALPPTPITPTSTQKTNHWHLRLSPPLPQTPIRLDPSPDANNLLTLIVSQDKSPEYIKTISLSSVRENLTAGDVIEELRKAGHENYRFQDGQGCRHWLITSLAVLRATGVLRHDEEVEEAEEALRKVWGDGGELVKEEEQSEVVVGTFL